MATFNTGNLTPPTTAGLIPADAGRATICQAYESVGWLDFLDKLKASGVVFDDQTLPNLLTQATAIVTQLTTLNSKLDTLNSDLATIKTAIEGISLSVSPTDLTALIEAIYALQLHQSIQINDGTVDDYSTQL